MCARYEQQLVEALPLCARYEQRFLSSSGASGAAGASATPPPPRLRPRLRPAATPPMGSACGVGGLTSSNTTTAVLMVFKYRKDGLLCYSDTCCWSCIGRKGQNQNSKFRLTCFQCFVINEGVLRFTELSSQLFVLTFYALLGSEGPRGWFLQGKGDRY